MPRRFWSVFLALLFPLFPLFARADAPGALPSFRDVARKVRPAVVNLSVVKSVKAGPSDPFMDQFMGRFFEQPQGGQGDDSVPQQSLGSGVIVDAGKGYLLTNNHVVEGADTITVKLADKREFAGVVVGRDPKTDLAVVKIKAAAGLSAAAFGDSDAVEVGDWVLAVGSPFGLEQTVSHGIISAKGRVIGEGPYDDFLQTDAPINPGNSGGPLVDLNGAIVGINTAISTQSGGSEGVGFAIPSDLARSIYLQLVSKGKVVRGWLGISIQELDASLASRFGLAAGAQGVLVADVLERGPAQKAGLRSGDVVLAYNGQAVASVRALQGLVAETPVGGQAELTLWRDGRTKLIRLGVGDMDQSDTAEAQAAGEGPETGRIGLEVRPMNDDELDRYPGESGAVVDSVKPGSPAEAAGLQSGDLILEWGRAQVAGPDDLARLAARLKPGQGLVIRVKREGRSLYLSLQAPDAKP